MKQKRALLGCNHAEEYGIFSSGKRYLSILRMNRPQTRIDVPTRPCENVCYGETDGAVNPVDRCAFFRFIICSRAVCDEWTKFRKLGFKNPLPYYLIETASRIDLVSTLLETVIPFLAAHAKRRFNSRSTI